MVMTDQGSKGVFGRVGRRPVPYLPKFSQHIRIPNASSAAFNSQNQKLSTFQTNAVIPIRLFVFFKIYSSGVI